MFEYIRFVSVAGSREERDLRLFTLTTCAFCARSAKYLSDRGFAYLKANVDELPLESRKMFRNEIHRRFASQLRYPMLVVDGKTLLRGFEEREWEEALGSPEGGRGGE